MKTQITLALALLASPVLAANPEVGGAAMRSDVAHELIAFFEARRGRVHGFRFRDPVDWKSCAPRSWTQNHPAA